MNKKQIFFSWLGGLAIAGIFGFNVYEDIMNPDVFIYCVSLSIPVAIVSILLIYTLRTKNSSLNTEKKLFIGVLVFLMVNISLGLNYYSYSSSSETLRRISKTERYCSDAESSSNSAESSCQSAQGECAEAQFTCSNLEH